MTRHRAGRCGLRRNLAIGQAIWLLLAAAFLALLPDRAAAQIGSERYAAMVVEARTGRVLIAANADEARYPASLTKMMTLYMLFDALREGRVALNTPIRMTEEAASRPPSKLALPPGATLTVEQAILSTGAIIMFLRIRGVSLGNTPDHPGPPTGI